MMEQGPDRFPVEFLTERQELVCAVLQSLYAPEMEGALDVAPKGEAVIG